MECIALARLPQAPAGQAALLHALTSSLRMGGPAVQAAAAAALGALMRAYPLEEADGGMAGAAEAETLGTVGGQGDACARPVFATHGGAGTAEAETLGIVGGDGARLVSASRGGAGAVEVVTLGFVSGLGDAGAAVRCGSAAALGALPARLLRPAATAVLEALSAAALVRALWVMCSDRSGSCVATAIGHAYPCFPPVPAGMY